MDIDRDRESRILWAHIATTPLHHGIYPDADPWEQQNSININRSLNTFWWKRFGIDATLFDSDTKSSYLLYSHRLTHTNVMWYDLQGHIVQQPKYIPIFYTLKRISYKSFEQITIIHHKATEPQQSTTKGTYHMQYWSSSSLEIPFNRSSSFSNKTKEQILWVIWTHKIQEWGQYYRVQLNYSVSEIKQKMTTTDMQVYMRSDRMIK
jgi:hypothetical protein